ncbi:MAG: helix-turn-helix domain-containing protein [Thermoplasmata archaeon]|nr:helix-turn-helix domain-containing protein [Thermoplasmata archaeon]
MIEAVLSVKLPNIWIATVIDKFSVEIRVMDLIPYGDNGAQHLIEMKLGNENLDTIIDYLEGLDGVNEVSFETIDDRKVMGIVKTKMCFGCRSLMESDVFKITSKTMPDGRIEWLLIANDRSGLQKLIKSLEENEAQPKLIKLTSIKEDELLTERQEKIVKTAYDRGYYDFPKRIGVKELAEMFEVSTATLSEILRRGQKKIIETYFEKS